MVNGLTYDEIEIIDNFIKKIKRLKEAESRLYMTKDGVFLEINMSISEQKAELKTVIYENTIKISHR